MQYHVDDLNMFEGNKYCRCKKKVFIAASGTKLPITGRMLFININHITTYRRTGNNVTIATREGYLYITIEEFNVYFEPANKPEEAYTHCRIQSVTIDKESFNKINPSN